MPIIKSAKKRARQNIVRKERLKPFRTRMLTLIKSILNLTQQGKVDQAKVILKDAYQAIDTATKKNIIHKNTADRKKSLVQKTISRAEANAPKKTETKTSAPKKVPAKKNEEKAA